MTTNMQSCTPRWPSPWPTVSPAIRCSDTNRWPRGLTRGAPGAASATRRLARPASGSGDAGGAYRRRILYGLRLGQAPALHDEFQALGANLPDAHFIQAQHRVTLARGEHSKKRSNLQGSTRLCDLANLDRAASLHAPGIGA